MKNLRSSEWLGKLLTPSPHYKLENKDLYFTLTTAWNSNSPLYLNFLNKITAIRRKRKLPFLTSGEVNFSQATSRVDASECVHSQSLQLDPTLCDPVDSSLPGSSVHGILQARILGWVTMSSSSGSS